MDRSMGRTQDLGMVRQTAILNRLVQLGFEVLLPWNSSLGYDLAYLVEKEETHSVSSNSRHSKSSVSSVK